MLPGEIVDLRLEIPDRGTLALRGAVVAPTPRVGFSVRFVEVPPATLALLQAAVDALRQRQPA